MGLFDKILDDLRGAFGAAPVAPPVSTPSGGGMGMADLMAWLSGSSGGSGRGPDHFFDINPLDQAQFDWMKDYQSQQLNFDQSQFDWKKFMDQAGLGLNQGGLLLDQDKFDWMKDLQGSQNDLDWAKFDWGKGEAQADRDAKIQIAQMQAAAEAQRAGASAAAAQAQAAAAMQSANNQLQVGMANAANDAERNVIQQRWNEAQAMIAKMQQDGQAAQAAAADATNRFQAIAQLASSGANDATNRMGILAQLAGQDAQNQLGLYNADIGAYNAQTGRYGQDINAYNAATGRYQADVGAYNAETGRYGEDINKYAAGTGRYNALAQALLGNQANQTGQFGAETARATGMGNLALENNKFILDAATKPQNMWALQMMGRGFNPDWNEMAAGNPLTQGAKLQMADVMNAYKPTTAAPQFGDILAQLAGQMGSGWTNNLPDSPLGKLPTAPGGSLPTAPGGSLPQRPTLGDPSSSLAALLAQYGQNPVGNYGSIEDMLAKWGGGGVSSPAPAPFPYPGGGSPVATPAAAAPRPAPAAVAPKPAVVQGTYGSGNGTGPGATYSPYSGQRF